jgi:hypothetical protein
MPSTRFLSTNCLFLILIARYLRRKVNEKQKFIQKSLIFYLFMYNLLGIMLFPLKKDWM